MMLHNHKRKLYLAITVVILFLLPSAYAFRNMMNGKRFLSMWTWMGGSSQPQSSGNYGIQGSSAPTPPLPGSRMNSCSWTDSTGNKWFFGGYVLLGTSVFNDLWKYDPVNDQWTWMSGSSTPNASANYGVQGIPAATNVPGARQGCTGWVDASDNLWMLGGYSGSNYYNDLWRFNPGTNQWTWITGVSSANNAGTYGTKGVAAPANTPSGRGNVMSWKDASGNFWLFGGLSSAGQNNDLWKFDTSLNQWAWISGSNTAGITNGIYGTQGSAAPVPPLPGARSNAASCVNPVTGDQWFFGGISGGSNYYNDLWKYNPTTDQWTWMSGSHLSGAIAVHGTKGVAAATNMPGVKSSGVCWVDLSGNFWLFGGLITGSPQTNDLWKYDISTNLWTWMAGSNTINQPSTYGTQGVADAANTPGARTSPATWVDNNGDLWLFGGFNLNDLWKFDMSVNQWIWVSGVNGSAATTSVYGTQGSSAAASLMLGSRYSSTTWTDASGNQWIFGGNSNGGYRNDLWKYNPTTTEWVWMTGSSAAGQVGVYGTKGVAAVSNTPGARQGSASWTDASGNLWLFGGLTGSYVNDLWKYDPTTNQWTWISGANTAGQVGVYGTQNTPSVSNIPGARQGSASWTDASGNFWLFGGYNGTAYFNDLWKYNPNTNEWTWVHGSSSTGQAGVYGTKGVAGVSNTPGARALIASTKDASGTLWLFGGSTGSSFNDLWKFDTATNQWTWVSGLNGANQAATYGTQGVAAGANVPGARFSSVIWVEANNIWIFGGGNSSNRYNDLWKFDTTTNQWTWMLGANTVNQLGTYGTLGTPGVSNTPGARSYSTGWRDASNKLWLFGGMGHANTPSVGYLNDLWTYDPAINQWTWFKGANIIDVVGIHGTLGSTAGVSPSPGARNHTTYWKDSSGNFWLFGGNGYSSTATSGNLNDLWKYDPVAGKWTWMSGGVTISANGVYGSKGVAAATNLPGARYGSHGFVDSSGDLWLFGGYGHGSSGSANLLNDLWKYDLVTGEWTWMSGASTINTLGVYGTQGVAAGTNVPGSRYLGARWTDASGNFWLRGGNGLSATLGAGYLNDLWKYDPASGEWTWISGSTAIGANGVYGSKGSPALVPPHPGSRNAGVAWADTVGNFWIHSGYGVGEFELSGYGNLNDLWKYNLASGEWIWMTGSNTTTQAGVYGTQGTPAASNTPGARQSASSWIDADDNLWLFGGQNGNKLNDLWKYDPTINQWAWMTGSNTVNAVGVYGTKGVAAPANTPGSRYSAAAWSTSQNYFWIFGGYDNGGNTNDLWKYDPATNQWTWVSGVNTIYPTGAYGVQGSPAAVSPMPLARSYATTWTDASGNFWMFGGNTSAGVYNDLWKYTPSTDQWMWVSGGNSPNIYPNYGSKGVPSVANFPGSRYGSASWVDNSGSLWLFGGYGYANNSSGSLNDLWKYDPLTNEWTWFTGATTVNAYGTYGTSGTPGVSNTPGTRQYAASWKDASDNLWLMGGNGYASGSSGILNDLWKYNIATGQWTWVMGSNGVNQLGNYGSQGVAAATNMPGARTSSTRWTDSNGNFWLFGGTGYGASAGSGSLYDLWKLDMTTNQWTWMKGPNTTSNYGTYGNLGQEASANRPGGRYGAIGWIDSNDNLWLFGGYGYAAGSFQTLGDLWRYNPITNNWTWMGGSSVTNTYGVYGTLQVPAVNNVPGSRQYPASWVSSDGMLWMFGGIGYTTNSSGYLNDLWRYRFK